MAPFVPRRSRSRPARHGGIRAEIARFTIAGLIAVIVIGAGTFFAVRSIATSQAVDAAKTVTDIDGHGIVEPALTPDLLGADPAAVARLDAIVRRRILGSRVTRVKIWRRDGTIVYSDEHRLIGSRFALGPQELAVLANGEVDAGVSDLSQPENRYEKQGQDLLEVYLSIAMPDGTPLLFETYQPVAAITADEQHIWSSFLPVLMGGLALLFAVQVPLAFSLARRVERGRIERERLLQRAIDASDGERRRIAADLHDGVVQQLAGISFSLGVEASRLRSGHAVPAETGDLLARAEDETRRSVRDLRTLIVEIAPRNLDQASMHNVLGDLIAPLRDAGINAVVEAPDTLVLTSAQATLIFRVAQELIRNVSRHAMATEVNVRLRRDAEAICLEVTDNGRGFTDADLDRQRREGHIGLTLLRDLARDQGADLRHESVAGKGTTALLQLPRADRR